MTAPAINRSNSFSGPSRDIEMQPLRGGVRTPSPSSSLDVHTGHSRSPSPVLENSGIASNPNAKLASAPSKAPQAIMGIARAIHASGGALNLLSRDGSQNNMPLDIRDAFIGGSAAWDSGQKWLNGNVKKAGTAVVAPLQESPQHGVAASASAGVQFLREGVTQMGVGLASSASSGLAIAARLVSDENQKASLKGRSASASTAAQAFQGVNMATHMVQGVGDLEVARQSGNLGWNHATAHQAARAAIGVVGTAGNIAKAVGMGTGRQDVQAIASTVTEFAGAAANGLAFWAPPKKPDVPPDSMA